MTAIDDAKATIQAVIASGAPGSITPPILRDVLIELADAADTDKSDVGHTHDDRYYLKAEVEPVSAKGAANGYAGLDGTGKVPVGQLPAAVTGGLSYQGTWNASTNTPTLASGTGTKGYYYVVSAAGATNLDGITDWKIGDWAVYNGSAWEKIDNTDAVASVAGKTGAVTLDKADVGLSKLWTRGADIASAATVDLDAATGDYLLITGTTAITAITLADGQRRRVRFGGILTLTHGASLILPTAANIATAAGDVAEFQGEAGSVVRCVSYAMASGAPLVGAAIASQAEAEAGTDNTKQMTPLRTSNAIAAWGHAPDVLVEDRRTSGTDGGTATSGSRFTRVLNTLVRNLGSLASLASNQVTLPAGSYYIEWGCAGYTVAAHKSWLRNVTDGADAGAGLSCYSHAAGFGFTVSSGAAFVTIAASKAFSIEHRVQTTKADTGCGLNTAFGTEVYAYMRIWKCAV